QYYNDYIKRYAKGASPGSSESETKRTYNEFKYILYATPLAVALFLLIMMLAVPDPVETLNERASRLNNVTEAAVVSERTGLKMGDAPYAGIFGSPVYDSID